MHIAHTTKVHNATQWRHRSVEMTMKPLDFNCHTSSWHLFKKYFLVCPLTAAFYVRHSRRKIMEEKFTEAPTVLDLVDKLWLDCSENLLNQVRKETKLRVLMHSILRFWRPTSNLCAFRQSWRHFSLFHRMVCACVSVSVSHLPMLIHASSNERWTFYETAKGNHEPAKRYFIRTRSRFFSLSLSLCRWWLPKCSASQLRFLTK